MSSWQSDWVDPRPPRSRRSLAARKPIGAARRLVFFDNSKLSPPYDRWMPVAPPILARLEQLGAVTREYSDLLLEPVNAHGLRVDRWCAEGVDGVFFGLCDAGVVQPTLLHAAAAEEAGIPAVVLCTSQVIELAAVAADLMLPGLPLVLLPVDRLASPADLAAFSAAAADEVVAALTSEPAVLRERARALAPFVADLARGDGDPSRHATFGEFARAQRMTDGLPVETPTREKVQRMIAISGRRAGDILIDTMSPSNASLCVEQAAACAVMAGCTPERFPVVVAALQAMGDPQYQLPLATITTHPGGHLVLVSGPAARAAGVSSGRGCLGPGHEANATIGRAVMLTLLDVGRAIPGLSTLSPFGSPAQYTYCFADAEEGPYSPLHTVLGHPAASIAWVLKCESPRNVLDHLSDSARPLLMTIARSATSLGANNAYVPSDLLVILNPEHAEVLAREGWSRSQIQQFIWDHARNPRKDLLGRGAKAEWPPEWRDWEELPVTASPDRIWVVVAGAPGPQSMVAIPWGYCPPCWRVIPDAARGGA